MKKQPLLLTFFYLGAAGFIQAQPKVTTIPFEYQKGVPYVQVVSTGKQLHPLRFILDTGASPTVFNHAITSSMNLERYAQNGICGDSPAMYVHQVHATCGGISLNHVALATSLTDISFGCGHWVDGLLGTDYFRNKIVTVDFKGHTLEIQEPESKSMVAALVDGIPFCDRHDSVFVTIQTPQSNRPLVFLLDTGSTRTFIDSKLAKNMGLGLAVKGQQVRTVGGKTVAFEANDFVGTCKGHALPSKIYTSDFSDLSWRYTKRIDGILGTDFLQAFKVHIDFQTREVQFN